MQPVSHEYAHEQQVEHGERDEVFPLQRQYLVDAQTGKGPSHPHHEEDDEEGLGKEPHEAGDVVHHRVEAVQPCDVEGHPSAQEDGGGHGGYDEEVQILGQVVEAEVHAAILRVVAGGQLAFGLGQVEGAAVTLGIAGDEVDEEGDDGGDVALEDEPAVGLSAHDFRDLQGARQHDHGEDAHAHGQLVAHDLRAASHGADERELVVGAPAGQQDAHHADARGREQEEDAYVEVEHLQPLVHGQAGEGEERGQDHHVGGQVVEEAVGALGGEDFLGEHLEHVAEHLQGAIFAHAVRAEAALEEGAHLALHVDQDDGEDGIHQHDAHAYDDTLDEDRQPFGHQGGQHLVYPACYNTKVKHLLN